MPRPPRHSPAPPPRPRQGGREASTRRSATPRAPMLVNPARAQPAFPGAGWGPQTPPAGPTRQTLRPAQPREVASGASSRSGAAPEIPDFSSTPPRHGTDGETEVHSVAATRPRSPCARGLEPGCATSRWEARGTAQVGRGEARRAPAPLPRQRPSLTSCRRARSLSSRAPPPLRTWPRPSVRPAPRPPRSPLRPGRPLRVAAAATTS